MPCLNGTIRMILFMALLSKANQIRSFYGMTLEMENKSVYAVHMCIYCVHEHVHFGLKLQLNASSDGTFSDMKSWRKEFICPT